VWPGNVRELRNMMERAVLLCEGDRILAEHLLLENMSENGGPAASAWPAAPALSSFPTPPAPHPLPAAIDAGLGSRATVPMSAMPEKPDDPEAGDAERERILRVLAECGGNQSRAARELGMARSTLVLRLNSYQIPRPRK